MPGKYRKLYKKNKTAYSKLKKLAAPKRILNIVHKDGMKGRIFKVVRTQKVATYLYNPSTVTDVFFGFAFKLNDLPNYTEFVDLYDSYCISKIEFIAIPVGVTGLQIYSSDILSTIAYVVDYDDNATPASFDELMQYEKVKIQEGYKKFKVNIVPRISTEIYKTALTTGYGVGAARSWLDCANPDIPHYGLKIGMTPATVAAVCEYQVYIKYHLEFRNVR